MEALRHVKGSARETPEFRFHFARGGTAGGLKPEHAPIPLLPGCHFWLRLDSELIGAGGDSGYPDPVSVDHVLTRRWEEVREWFSRPLDVRLSPRDGVMWAEPVTLAAILGNDEEIRTTAAALIREVSIGRNTAAAEALEPKTT